MCESHGDIKVQAFPACAAFPTPEFYCDREVTKAQVLREVLNSVALFSRHFRLPWPGGAELSKMTFTIVFLYEKYNF